MDINGNNFIRNIVPLSHSATVNRKKELKEEKIAPEIQAVKEKTEQIHKDHELRNAVSETNHLSIVQNRRLSFSIDKTTEMIVVKVIDKNTDEVIRQIPREEMLRLAAHFKETNSLIYDSNILETSSG